MLQKKMSKQGNNFVSILIKLNEIQYKKGGFYVNC
jgi:hypothetical protein